MSAKRRLPLFYLIDSVCQVSKNKQLPAYRDLASKHLLDIILLVVPEEGEARDKAFPVVQKVHYNIIYLFIMHFCHYIDAYATTAIHFGKITFLFIAIFSNFRVGSRPAFAGLEASLDRG